MGEPAVGPRAGTEHFDLERELRAMGATERARMAISMDRLYRVGGLEAVFAAFHGNLTSLRERVRAEGSRLGGGWIG